MGLAGLILTRQFPNREQPHRGTFVVEQMLATSGGVSWRVIAPVPWIPKVLSNVLDRPFVKGPDTMHGVHVDRPRYPVLPRRVLYTTVAGSMARASRKAFDDAVATHAPAFVHAHELYPSGLAAARLARDAKLPLVVSVHGSDLYSNLVRPKWRDALREVVRSASAIVCVGTKLAEDTVAQLGADPARVSVIPDCFDDTAFAFVDREYPARRPIRIFSVGRLVPEKGLDVLLHATSAVIAEGYDLELRIAGTGFLDEELRALARSLGLEQRVAFLGAITVDELREEYALADLYVQASRREGFGLALVEAQATGLFAVATDSGGPSDIVTAESGILVDPEDVAALTDGIIEGLLRSHRFDAEQASEDMRSRFGRKAVGERLLGLYADLPDWSARS